MISESVGRDLRASRVCVPRRSDLVDVFITLAVFMLLLSLANWAPVMHSVPSMAIPFLRWRNDLPPGVFSRSLRAWWVVSGPS